MVADALDTLVAAEMLTKHARGHYSYAHSYLHDAAHSLLPVTMARSQTFTPLAPPYIPLHPLHPLTPLTHTYTP